MPTCRAPQLLTGASSFDGDADPAGAPPHSRTWSWALRRKRRALPPFLVLEANGWLLALFAGALFNTFFIRLPFLALLAGLMVNVLLGGGVVIGGYQWPSPPPTDSLWSYW